MDTFSSFNQNSQKQKKTQGSTNFIEALKGFGSSFKQQAKDAAFGVPSKPQSGDLKAEQPFNFENYLKSRERQIESREKQKYERKIQEERLIFHHKQEEAKLQIKAVQEELKKLASATTGLSNEVKKAVFTAAVEPGTYHENFFDRIRNLIELARKKIVESKSWLETFNKRSKKRSHYWFNVKKSGTKFMLSQERYMATQVG